jgi:hypothetical protein
MLKCNKVVNYLQEMQNKQVISYGSRVISNQGLKHSQVSLCLSCS